MIEAWLVVWVITGVVSSVSMYLLSTLNYRSLIACFVLGPIALFTIWSILIIATELVQKIWGRTSYEYRILQRIVHFCIGEKEESKSDRLLVEWGEDLVSAFRGSRNEKFTRRVSRGAREVIRTAPSVPSKRVEKAKRRQSSRR
jgi:hypothetical protein